MMMAFVSSPEPEEMAAGNIGGWDGLVKVLKFCTPCSMLLTFFFIRERCKTDSAFTAFPFVCECQGLTNSKGSTVRLRF